MSAFSTLSERHLRAMIAVVEDGRRDAPGPRHAMGGFDRLTGLIGCDALALVEHDLRHERTPLMHGLDEGERCVCHAPDDPEDDGNPEDRVYWRLYRAFRPCHDPRRPPAFG